MNISAHTSLLNLYDSIKNVHATDALDIKAKQYIENFVLSEELDTALHNFWNSRFSLQKRSNDKFIAFKENLWAWATEARSQYNIKDIVAFLVFISDSNNLITFDSIIQNWSGSLDDLVPLIVRTSPLYPFYKKKTLGLTGSSHAGRGELFFLLFGNDTELLETPCDLRVSKKNLEIKQSSKRASIKPLNTKPGASIDNLTEELASKLNLTYIPVRERPSGRSTEYRNEKKSGSIFHFDPRKSTNPFVVQLSKLGKSTAVQLLKEFYTGLYTDQSDIVQLATDMYDTLGTSRSSFVLASFLLNRSQSVFDLLVVFDIRTERVVLVTDFSTSALVNAEGLCVSPVIMVGPNNQGVPDGWVDVSISKN